MPNQTIKTDYFYPDGLRMEASTDGGSSWLDIGVLAAGVSFTFNFDKVTLEPGNAAKPVSRAKNMSVAIEPSAIWSWDIDNLVAMGGGLFVKESVAAAPVIGGTQNVVAGYTYDKGIELTGQNASGAIPTSIVVTQDPSGTPVVLTLNTDYQILLVNGQWNIFIKSGATGNNTLAFEVVSDYTPAASEAITCGTSSKEIARFQLRFRHYTDVALTTHDFEFYVYNADMNAGMQFNKKGVNEDGVDEIVAGFTGEIDDTRADNDQLFKLLIA